MRWYADNSELNGIRGGTIPDMLLFGGVAVPPELDQHLRDTVESVKAKYGHRRAPVKWNFKDLQKVYQRQGMEDLYKELLTSSKEWRTEIFKNVSDLDFTVVIACVQSHSKSREVIKDVKENLTRYVFSNGLMRLALHAQEIKADRVQVILDWPDKGCAAPFDSEYVAAYNNGKTKEGNVKYNSGPLSNNGFMDSPVYTNMNHSTLMQFADLVLGATRGVLECAVGRKKTDFGLDMAKLIVNRYRGAPDQIYGRGISVASGDSTFKEKVNSFIKAELV